MLALIRRISVGIKMAYASRLVSGFVSLGQRLSVALIAACACVQCTSIESMGRVEPTYGVAFASFAPLDTDIFIADADGANARPLSSSPAFEANATFSQDGRWVVFSSNRAGSWDIYRAHADGSQLERLVDDPAFDDQAALSPDGKSLAFVSSRSGQADIWVMDMATKSLRNLTQHRAGDFRPAWSPDGQWIAFSTDRDSQNPRFPANDFVIRHSTQIHVVRANGEELRRVTTDQAFAGSPSWSSDGKRIVFYSATLDGVAGMTSAARRGGTSQIESVDVVTGERSVLTTGAGEKWSPQWVDDQRIGYVTSGANAGVNFLDGGNGQRGEFNSPGWSADGRRMVFHREVASGWPPHRPWDSTDRDFKLTRTGIFPSWSPSGDRYVSNDRTAGLMHNSILLFDANGTRRSVVFSHPDKNALAPDWSRKTGKIAFALGEFFQNNTGGSGKADIATINPDGSDLRVLTDGSSNYGFPSWSPDGRQIVYREATLNRNALHIIDVETGKSRVLLEGPGRYNFPAWSPAEDVIAFTAYIDGDSELYSIRADGTGLKRLTRSPGNDGHESWSPDGKWIAFTGASQGFKDEAVLHPGNPQPYGEITVIRADGSNARVLTDNPFEDGSPGWLPLKAR